MPPFWKRRGGASSQKPSSEGFVSQSDPSTVPSSSGQDGNSTGTSRLSALSRIFRPPRSHSPKLPLTDDSHSPCPNPSLSPSPHSSRQPLVTGTSRPLVSEDPMYAQNFPPRLVVDGTLDNSSNQPLQSAPPIIVGPSSAAHMPGQHSSVTLQATHPARPSDDTDSVQAQPSLVSDESLYPPSTSSQQASSSRRLMPPSGQDLSQPAHRNRGMFNQASNFSAEGTFIFNDGGRINITTSNNNTSSNQFMVGFFDETIPGAASDSHDRDPPPRCLPGTRSTILRRCLDFIHHCSGERKMRWVVGAAGVGKSAIMQNITESRDLRVASHASVFLAINQRNDGTKVIMTISYQFATKSDIYCQLIEPEIARDPSYRHWSMAKLFQKLIIELFIHNPQMNPDDRVLIIIDGLDECHDHHSQEELLRLISELCRDYPSSPIVWLIASRPEPPITSFFSRPEIIPLYEKEEIPVDSDEARADVKHFLRHGLKKIKEASESLDPEWPKEEDFWKLATAAVGLFAYAQTVIRYIGDTTIGDPDSQLSDVLKVIDNNPVPRGSRKEHPMAELDALYNRILSTETIINTRNLLLALASKWDWALYPGKTNFTFLCNWLGMTRNEAYVAINRLRSVLRVPLRDEAHRVELTAFHKSFLDYLSDYSRSKFSSDTKNEAQRSRVSCAFRISRQALDGIDFGDVDYGFHYGHLARGPGTGDKILLAWPIDQGVDSDDNELRLMMYKTAVGQIVSGIGSREPAFQTEFYIRLLTTRFQRYDSVFPYQDLRDLVFDEHRRDKFIKCGILRKVPLEAIKSSKNVNKAKFRFRRPTTAVTNPSSAWDPSCTSIHEQDSEWEEEMDEAWTTNLWRSCRFCFDRLEGQLQAWKARSPDHTALIMFTSTGECCVEFQFVEDGGSEWTYWFWIELSAEERKKYGSTV